MIQDDDDEEEEEDYPTGGGINDDDWVRLLEISDSAYAAATTSLQEQVETNPKDNHIKRSAKQKKESEFIFNKYCREQVEPPTKEVWSSTGKLPWRKDADLVTKVDKYLEISRSQAAAWWHQLRLSYGILEKIKFVGDSEVFLTNLDNKNRVWFNILTDLAISNVRGGVGVERGCYPDELEIIAAIFSQRMRLCTLISDRVIV